MNLIFQDKLAVFAVAAALLTAVAGCEKTGYPDAQPVSGPSATTTRVQLVNATPDASALNFLVENVQIGTPLAPGQATGYVTVRAAATPAAASQLRIDNAGGTLGTADIVTKPLLSPSLAYTLFATDSINRPRVTNAAGIVTDAGGVRGLQITDTLRVPAAGTARLRFFHLAPDAPAVSVRLINSAGASAGTINNRTYRQASGAALSYVQVPTGTYTVQVYAGATAPASLTATPVLNVPNVALADGKIYSIYARGLLRTRTLSAAIITHN